jgi:hypothetical protein
MSAMMIDTRRAYTAGPTFAQAHPRGRGFRVLSRIARVQADDSVILDAWGTTSYAPRHRRDVLPERALQALAV